MVAARPRREFHDKILHPIPVHIPPEPECNWKWESPQVPLWSTADEQSQLFWSAATCRSYGPGVRTKAATSRRTRYRTRYLSAFCTPGCTPLDRQLNSMTNMKHALHCLILLAVLAAAAAEEEPRWTVGKIG